MHVLTDVQVVVGLIPARSGNILSWRLIMKYFLWSSSLSLLIQEGHLSVSGERMCMLEDYISLSRKSEVRYTDHTRHDPNGLTGP